MFAYCMNNPVACVDPDGDIAETVFDVVSLGFSIAEVAANPYDPAAWASLVGDTIDLVPFVTGVGETVRGLRFVDKVGGDVLEIAKATDFADGANDLFNRLGKVNGFTKSSTTLGTKIHSLYKKGDGFVDEMKEYGKGTDLGIKVDYYDMANNRICELKPFNRRAAKAGMEQLKKYNKVLGGGHILRLEFY